MPDILLLPIHCKDRLILRNIQQAVSQTFPGFSCHIGPESGSLLNYCFDSKRSQYNASILLQNIASQLESPLSADYFLGVADADLYVPELNYVFGLANPQVRAGVISLYRLKPEYFGGAPDTVLYIDRVVKEAIHELGHVFGLPHDRNPDCVMFFSNSIVDTDRKSSKFCSSCRASLENTLHP
ncbi:MAG: archaemetzincin family Zn-dependent metalloprotease [Thaumarchaeota archaeon]|nr:archaemetzincin family Zn-dependent metalloprotease [Nitrososphaerota archaeon]MCL5318959.1 archaemetzincin family Zn-dependent metalloprotease [Nitrososphaerota archaeon]